MKLLLLDTTQALVEEGERQHNALASTNFHRFLQDRKVYSLRDNRGGSLLTFSLEKDNVVRHVVGPYNRPPTPEELAELTKLIKKEGWTLEYDPNTPH